MGQRKGSSGGGGGKARVGKGKHGGNAGMHGAAPSTGEGPAARAQSFAERMDAAIKLAKVCTSMPSKVRSLCPSLTSPRPCSTRPSDVVCACPVPFAMRLCQQGRKLLAAARKRGGEEGLHTALMADAFFGKVGKDRVVSLRALVGASSEGAVLEDPPPPGAATLETSFLLQCALIELGDIGGAAAEAQRWVTLLDPLGAALAEKYPFQQRHAQERDDRIAPASSDDALMQREAAAVSKLARLRHAETGSKDGESRGSEGQSLVHALHDALFSGQSLQSRLSDQSAAELASKWLQLRHAPEHGLEVVFFQSMAEAKRLWISVHRALHTATGMESRSSRLDATLHHNLEHLQRATAAVCKWQDLEQEQLTSFGIQAKIKDEVDGSQKQQQQQQIVKTGAGKRAKNAQLLKQLKSQEGPAGISAGDSAQPQQRQQRAPLVAKLAAAPSGELVQAYLDAHPDEMLAVEGTQWAEMLKIGSKWCDGHVVTPEVADFLVVLEGTQADLVQPQSALSSVGGDCDSEASDAPPSAAVSQGALLAAVHAALAHTYGTGLSELGHHSNGVLAQWLAHYFHVQDEIVAADDTCPDELDDLTGVGSFFVTSYFWNGDLTLGLNDVRKWLNAFADAHLRGASNSAAGTWEALKATLVRGRLEEGVWDGDTQQPVREKARAVIAATVRFKDCVHTPNACVAGMSAEEQEAFRMNEARHLASAARLARRELVASLGHLYCSHLDIALACCVFDAVSAPVTAWHKSRLEQEQKEAEARAAEEARARKAQDEEQKRVFAEAAASELLSAEEKRAEARAAATEDNGASAKAGKRNKRRKKRQHKQSVTRVEGTSQVSDAERQAQEAAKQEVARRAAVRARIEEQRAAEYEASLARRRAELEAEEKRMEEEVQAMSAREATRQKEERAMAAELELRHLREAEEASIAAMLDAEQDEESAPAADDEGGDGGDDDAGVMDMLFAQPAGDAIEEPRDAPPAVSALSAASCVGSSGASPPPPPPFDDSAMWPGLDEEQEVSAADERDLIDEAFERDMAKALEESMRDEQDPRSFRARHPDHGAASFGGGEAAPGSPVECTAGPGLVAGTAGLTNDAGEYNCFLNTVIQSLWHLPPFRRGLLEVGEAPGVGAGAHTRAERLVHALRSVFKEYDAAANSITGGSCGGAVSTSALRVALAEVFAGSALFQESQMNDASEVLLELFDALTTAGHAFVDDVFGLRIDEHVHCEHCDLDTQKHAYVKHVHVVSATALRMACYGFPDGVAPLEKLLECVDTDMKPCDTDLKGCGSMQTVVRKLQSMPDVRAAQRSARDRSTCSVAWPAMLARAPRARARLSLGLCLAS